MARLRSSAAHSGHTILVVDDDATLLGTLEQLLLQDGHTVLTALGGAEAVRMCRDHDIHLMLLDYFMPEMTGEDVVREVRAFNDTTQIVLQTGYASERPARVMLRVLEIQGYHDKSEGPDKLLIWVDSALKAYRRSRALRASRDGLRHVLKVAPELHKLQPLENLLRGTLLQIQGLLGLSGAFVAAELSSTVTSEMPANPKNGLSASHFSDSHFSDSQFSDDNFIATLEHDAFNLQIGTGRFQDKRWRELEPEIQAAVRTAVQTGKTQRDQVLTIPLMVGLRLVGVIFCEREFLPETELELLEIFAAQVAVAIENVQTFESIKGAQARA
jgi:two-component system, cell cycle response regulator